MGLLSDSKSSVTTNTENITTNQDNRVAVTDQGVAISIDGAGGNTINFESADRVILDRAFDANAASTAAAVSLGTTAGGIASTNASLLGIIAGQQTLQTKAQLDSVRDISNDLLSGHRLLASTTETLANNYSTATRLAQTDAYNFSKGSLDNTLNFARDSLDASQAQSNTALAAIRQTGSTLLDFINTNIKPADQQAFQAVIPWLVGGTVLLGVFAFASRSR